MYNRDGAAGRATRFIALCTTRVIIRKHIYDEFYHGKRDYACTMCVIDLARVQRPCTTLDGTDRSAGWYTKKAW